MRLLEGGYADNLPELATGVRRGPDAERDSRIRGGNGTFEGQPWRWRKQGIACAHPRTGNTPRLPAVGRGRTDLSARARFVVCVLATLVLGPGVAMNPARAQRAPDPPGKPATPAPHPASDFAMLQGRWVRPDGGYVIAIRAVDAGGKLDAAYANPSPLPFARAEASKEGGTLKVFLELRAGGYNGSTYTLAYDPANDVLKGVYYQAVARQSYDVYFVRAR